MDNMDNTDTICSTLPDCPSKLIFGANAMLYMTLKANYDQTVPKLHVRINSSMIRHHI
jgi:hypothetical protein